MYELVLLLAMGLTVYYITSVLLYDDNPQPVSIGTKKVILYGEIDKETNTVKEITHPVGIFDYIRRVSGLYVVMDDAWIVNKKVLWLWLCPKCLSFWVSLFLAMVLSLSTFNIMPMVLVFPAAGLSYKLFQSERD